MPVQPVVGLVSLYKATPVISHVMVYCYSKLYNTSLPLVYLVEPIKRNSVINKEFSSIGQSYILYLRYYIREKKDIALCLLGGPY